MGEAVTIKLDSSTPEGVSDMEAYWDMLEYISAKSNPCIIVIETQGYCQKRECVMGDGMAKIMSSVGAVGMITDGGVRDTGDIFKQGFKIFASGYTAHHGPLRWSDLNEEVNIGGMNVKPRVLIHGNNDGCIVVPSQSHDVITDACRLVQDFEKKVHVVFQQTGIPLAEKRVQVSQFYDELILKIECVKNYKADESD